MCLARLCGLPPSEETIDMLAQPPASSAGPLPGPHWCFELTGMNDVTAGRTASWWAKGSEQGHGDWQNWDKDPGLWDSARALHLQPRPSQLSAGPPWWPGPERDAGQQTLRACTLPFPNSPFWEIATIARPGFSPPSAVTSHGGVAARVPLS